MPESELGVLLALVDRALESQIEALGARPQAWRALADAFALGRALDDGRETRAALIEVHRLLFTNGRRPVQAREAWLDAVVSAAAARAIAASQRGSPSTAALAAVVSHGAEGIALRAIAAVESNHGLQVDSATLATLVATLAPLAGAEIARKWKLAAALEAAARDARRVHELHSSSIEVKAVYFGRLLAATRPGRGLAAPGLEYEILHGSGLGVRDLDEVRATVAAAERVALAVARDLCSPAGLEAAG